MTESIASWITLSALFASAAWYIHQTTERTVHNIVMCFMSGILCLFGGFLFSGAVMKIIGSFDNAIVPALLVCTGTALCTAVHTLYRNKKTARQQT